MKRTFIILLLTIFLFSCERNSDIPDDHLKFYGDAHENIGFSVAKTADGYVIAGQYMEIVRESTPSGTFIVDSFKKMGVIRINSEGDVTGEPYIFGGELIASGTKVITLEDGTALVTGYITESGRSDRDIFVVKLDADGEGYSEKIYHTIGDQNGKDIIKTAEGYMILGTTDIKREPSTQATGNAEDKKDILLLRVNENLDLIDGIPAGIGYIGNDEGAAIKPDPYGGYVVVGTTDRSEEASQAGINIMVLRVNSVGSLTERKIIGGLKNETASDFELLSDGYLITGTSGNTASEEKGHIWKIPLNIFAAPEVDEDIILPGSLPFSINAMCRYKASSFLLAGHYGTGLSSRMLILSLDASYKPVSDRLKIEGGTGTQEAFDVICDEDENIITVGKNSYENNSMITFLKFRF